MADNSSSRKKSVIVGLLTFLLVGGGVFLFFIIQGSNDLTGPKNKNFHYGSAIRSSMVPFFRSIGILGEEESALIKAAEARLKSRGLIKEDGSTGLDMSDWVDKPAAASASASASAGDGGSRSASAGGPSAPIAKMNARGGGLAAGGGGGSQSSGGAARFGAGGQSGNTRITAGSSGAGGAGKDKGTLASLRGAQALLSSGLRSGSAMTAKSKWDKSFAAGGGGHSTGEMSYGKQGMISLDTIKSGEISNLKTTGGNSMPAASVPELDKEGTAKDADAIKAKETAKLAEDAAKQLLSSGLNSAKDKLTGGDKAGDAPTAPPANVTQVAEQPQPNGYYCPGQCDVGDGATIKDNPPTYFKSGDKWVATYTGQQTDLDGTVTFYKDDCVIDPNSGSVSSFRVFAGTTPGKLEKLPIGE